MKNPESLNPNRIYQKQLKTGTFIKKTCEECHKEFNHTVWWKGKQLCRNCYRFKKTSLITFHPNNYRPLISEEQALNKIYKVKGYIGPGGRRSTQVAIPPVLIGKYFKIILVDEKDVPEKYRFKKLKIKSQQNPPVASNDFLKQASPTDTGSSVSKRGYPVADIFPYGTSININKLNKKEILGEVEYDID